MESQKSGEAAKGAVCALAGGVYAESRGVGLTREADRYWETSFFPVQELRHYAFAF